MNRVAIIGASAGGLAVAEALRGAAYEGEITLVGDEHDPPYDRPPLSKQILTGEWGPDRLALRGREDLGRLHLDLRLGATATGLDPVERAVRLADRTSVPYDGLVVATGVRPRRLAGSEAVTGVHSLRGLEDAWTLKARLLPGRRLVIVGAGFLGAEVAAVARGLGVAVTMLESAPVPLALAVGDEAGRFLARLHTDHGVGLRTDVSVVGIVAEQGEVRGVELAGGTVLPADDVLVAIGSLPNTEWLAGSGLTIEDGLVCDEFSAAAPGVYGVGDVARWHNPLFGTSMRVEHRTNAAEQGIAVARNLLHPEDRRPFAPVPYFWSDQYGMRIQAHGYLRGHDEAVVVAGDTEGGSFLVAYRRGERLTGVLAVGMSPKALRPWRALVAAGVEWGEAVATLAVA
ncbi:FAD-dependent oxidoreductase [Promicromonospora sp. NPDC023987]|uniref:NAD(P)/FAD-dependent oxidoreductase n=1 Tax=Promicromonospora sp. NPDC023987 TaxID=3155360 RepID=UPI0034016402